MDGVSVYSAILTVILMETEICDQPSLPAPRAPRWVTCRYHSDLQSPLIQWAVLALDPIPGSSLQTRIQGTSKDGAILL